MKEYKVTVNGTEYQIQIELTNGSAAASAAPVAAAPQAAPATAPVAPAATGAGQQVNAPMPGTILDVKVNVGEKIKAGQVLMILEAMKMENEIMSPVDGTVTSVGVTKGTTVESGKVLCTIQ